MSQLEKISGVVENLRIEKGYQDLIFTKTDSQVAGIAAIGAAALGQAASATVLSNASAGAEVSMDFFACTVDGMPLRGAFHKVEFVNGDQIEFVIEPEGDFFTVHAARSPAARMLWMSQHQIRGINAQKACDLRWSVMYPTLAVIGIAICEFFRDENFGKYPFSAELMFYSLVFFSTLAITVWIRMRFRGFAHQATEVLRAFGYEDPEDVDLNRVHKQAQKALAASSGTLPPLVEPWSYRY
jgi:hypothetical protein